MNLVSLRVGSVFAQKVSMEQYCKQAIELPSGWGRTDWFDWAETAKALCLQTSPVPISIRLKTKKLMVNDRKATLTKRKYLGSESLDNPQRALRR